MIAQPFAAILHKLSMKTCDEVLFEYQLVPSDEYRFFELDQVNLKEIRGLAPSIAIPVLK